MEEKDKVSVIIPVFNAKKYINKTIESVIKQTYKNLEIILVDDGSTDDSKNIIDYYIKKDLRIKVIHKRNEGVSVARNVGIDNATGKYICFCDADDYLLEDYVEYMLKLIYINNADISLTTEMYTTFITKQIKKDHIEEYSPEKTTCEILLSNIPIGVYCKMFRTDFLKNNKIRFIPEIYIGEGFNFNTMAFQRANKIMVGHKRIYFYRRNNFSSATTKFNIEKWKNGLEAINIIKKNFILDSKKILKSWKYANWRTNCDVYNNIIIASAEKECNETYKKCLYIARTQGMCALTLPVKLKEKICAVMFFIYPKIIPMLKKMRNKRYKEE